MALRSKLLFGLSLVAVLPIIWIDRAHPLLAALALLVLAVVAWTGLFWFETQRADIQQMARELQKLRQGYEEMDEHAKLIVKTDLELHRTQAELDRKVSGLYTLHRLGTLLARAVDLDKLFSHITEEIILELGFDKGLILMKDNGRFQCRAAFGYARDALELLHRLVADGSCASLCDPTGGTVLLNHRDDTDDDTQRLLAALGVASLISVPLVVENALAGYLVFGNAGRGHRASRSDAELLSVLANQIAAAIGNTTLYEQLWRSHRELEARVQERTRELATVNEELVRMNKMKSDFVSAVSHELRTPLTSIKGYANILISGKLGEVNEPVKERLAKIDKHSNKLTKLVNDLLDIARIESGRVEMVPKTIAVKDLLDGVADLVRPQMKEKGLALDIRIAPGIRDVTADVGQLERVFINLLSNAIKYTPPGGSITVTASADHDHYRFDVADTGVGIPPEDQPKLFQEFFRANNQTTPEQTGTGLGLSLVKRIVEAHRGRIWFESQSNKGTTFSFTLPKLAPQAAPA